jgi:hypothetical protein
MTEGVQNGIIRRPEHAISRLRRIIMSLKITVKEIKEFKGVTTVTGATLCG